MQELMLPDACISGLAFDEWAAGELEAEIRAQLEAHLARCPRCLARNAELEAERASFLSQAPSFEAHARLRAQQRGSSHARPKASTARTMGWSLGATALLAACAVALMMLRPQPELLTTRNKGGPQLGFFVKRAQRVTRGASGDTLQPGDLLRFAYSSGQGAYLAILGRDERAASLYYPTASAEAAHVNAAQDRALNFSVQLDATLGGERIFGVFCPRAFETAPLTAALGTTGSLPVLPDCHVDVIVLRKALAP
ncbi:MAG TPA: zf-HC2 domain-containing protein [Polyangiales bacterium]